MSPSFLAYLETLTCQHNAQFFHAEAEKLGLKVRDDIERGNPLNKGDVLTASHPVVRTNPVTGWKALFVNRGFSHRIEGVTKDESDMIMKYINDISMMNCECLLRQPGRQRQTLYELTIGISRLPSPLQVGEGIDRYLGQPIDLALGHL